MDKIKLFDVVALVEDLPEHGLYRGQVGTVVEIHRPGHFEVEFVDLNSGDTYGLAPVRSDQVILLHYAPVHRT
jgi:Domain of unknown function (DUF4926)